MENKLLPLWFFLVFSAQWLCAQERTDTANIVCDRINPLQLRPGINYLRLPVGNAQCDSMYLVDRFTYLKANKDIKACQNFVQLYKIYRDQAKESDKEMGEIINSYEGIIKTKDEAYTTVLKEYYTLNQLLDKSIQQTSTAVETGKSSLGTLTTSLETISKQSERIKEDLKEMKTINRNNKLIFCLGGGVAGLLIGFFIAK